MTVTAQGTSPATRSFDKTSVDAGMQLVVTIAAAGFGQAGGVTETLPTGFTYVSSSGIDASQVTLPGQGGLDSNQVRFTLQGDTTFTYTVTASSTPGTYQFSGTLRDADRNDSDVGGATDVTVTMPATPTPTPTPTATPNRRPRPRPNRRLRRLPCAVISPAKISRIAPRAKNVTLSANDEVVLGVMIYGLQNVNDQGLASM